MEKEMGADVLIGTEAQGDERRERRRLIVPGGRGGGGRGRRGGVSMGVLLCSSRTDAFPYLLPGEKQTPAAHMKGSFPGSI